jgi:hypothetical protein
MDKYRNGFEQKIKPRMDHSDGHMKVEPFREAQVALGRAQFVQREREQFFGEAYSEILADLFVTWLKTEPHAQKEREFLYHTAMALGSVKEKLVGIEMYGNNVRFMAQQNKSAQEGTEETNE